MHITWNIKLHELSPLWHLAYTVPLLLNLVVHLPSVISQFSLVQAFYIPDPDVMDSTISQANEVEEDLRFLRRQLDERGNWQEKLPKVLNSKEELANFLKSLNVTFAMERIGRVFQAMDQDASGQLDA